MKVSTVRGLILSLALAGLAVSGRAAPDTWKIDPAHSSIGFTVRHFVSKVPGIFSKFEGSLTFDPANPSASKAEALIQTASVNTNQEKRDAHLNTEDFFLTSKFPTITFKSKSWTKINEDTFSVVGDLTIKDVTKQVTLETKLLGIGPGSGGKTLSGWEAKTKVDRRDFGITYGPGVVGNDVEITINIEAVKQ